MLDGYTEKINSSIARELTGKQNLSSENTYYLEMSTAASVVICVDKDGIEIRYPLDEEASTDKITPITRSIHSTLSEERARYLLRITAIALVSVGILACLFATLSILL